MICGLGLPNQKFWVRQWIGDRLKKILKTFFWRTLVTVSLASSIPVLGLERFCPRNGCPWRLGIGLVFFLCPWPWPRALCPRIHLWFQKLSLKSVQKSSLISRSPKRCKIYLNKIKIKIFNSNLKSCLVVQNLRIILIKMLTTTLNCFCSFR